MGFGGCGVAFVLSFAMVCTLLAGVNVVAFAADDELTDTVAVQKFYWNPAMGGSGEHIYTVDEDEIDYYSGLSDWNNEGDAWNAPLMSDNPVYRLCNYNTGEHIWVADKGYADLLVEQGWTIEQGIAFYSADADGVPVYRLWNGTDGVGCHHYTTNEEEIIGMQLAGWKLEDVAFYGVKEEEPVGEMVAEQTGAREITITLSEDATETETFTVLKGSTAQIVASTEFYGDVVVLTLDNDIKEDEYTVISSDEMYDPAYFVGEKAELEGIYISDKLISMGGTNYAVGVVTLDQFGDAYTVNTWDSELTSVPNNAINWNKTGMLTITAKNALTEGAQYSVTLVSGDVIGTQTVTVSAASAVAEIEVGELTMTDAEALVNTTGRIDAADIAVSGAYYFPIYAKDQYGNPMNATMLNTMLTNNSLVVSPLDVTTGVINAETTGGKVFNELDDGTVVLYVKGNGSSNGLGNISIVSTTGATASASALIAMNEVIQELSIEPVDQLVQGVPNPVIVYAENQYGEEVDLYSEVDYAPATGASVAFTYTPSDKRGTVVGQTKVDLTGATLTVKKDPVSKTTTFTVTPNASTVFAIMTANASSVTTSTWTAGDAMYPESIAGISDKVITTLPEVTVADAADVTNLLPANKTYIDYYTQYSNELPDAMKPTLVENNKSAGLTKDNYYVTLSKATGGAGATDLVAATGETGIKRNADKSGVDTYTLKLYKATSATTLGDAIDEYNFKVTVVESDDIVSFDASLKSLDGNLYTGQLSTASGDSEQVVLYATDKLGNVTQVPIDGTNIKTVFRTGTMTTKAGATGVITLTNAGNLTTTTAETYTPATGAVEGSATVDVYVAGSIVDSVDVSFSNAPQSGVMFVCTNADQTEVYDLNQGIVVTSNAKGSYSYFNTGKGKGVMLIDVDGTASDDTQIAAPDYMIVCIDQYGLSNFDAVFAGTAMTKVTKSGAAVESGDAADAGAANLFGAKGSMVLTCGNLVQVVPITLAQ